ncbi:cytochrome C [Acidobacteria bacterium AH-259-A15]|nr:cytochrome C [Acidobacteria bacterium AH-259-A15]
MKESHRNCIPLILSGSLVLGLVFFFTWRQARAHIIPPEKFHPVAESYRRMNFLLNLNPVLWAQVHKDADTIAEGLATLSYAEAKSYGGAVNTLIDKYTESLKQGEETPGPAERKETAREVFELTTRTVARILTLHLQAAEKSLSNYARAFRELNEARHIWASFEHEVKATDRPAFRRLGACWLELASALGSPGILQVGFVPAKTVTFQIEAQEIVAYIKANYGESFSAPVNGKLAPLPQHSPTFDSNAKVPVKLPPGNNINKQVPRPRQILNMAARGVDESETILIALGDMAFDSPYIFGEPSRSLNFNCNTCHNKGVTNPQFVIPGLSAHPGGVDVSNSLLAPHANNGVFDPVDIPDLRGIRFTAPYGRNGRFASLREFVRNGIMNEFNGPEPDPVLLDAIVAYMNEFDFLPNPYLNPDGSLSANASASAKRGEMIFHEPFSQMGGQACSTCHVPSAHFLDHKRHDIVTAKGSDPYSLDRALDTPTLLNAKYTAPYFHDGSQPTLRAVVEWFNNRFTLALTKQRLDDLTAYVETVGEGVDAYEDTPYYLDAEMEEFGFFLSTYESLKRKDKPELMNITFQTIGIEIRNHKWELQDLKYLPAMERLAELMDEAYAANLRGDRATVDAKVAEYRKSYRENVDHLK